MSGAAFDENRQRVQTTDFDYDAVDSAAVDMSGEIQAEAAAMALRLLEGIAGRTAEATDHRRKVVLGLLAGQRPSDLAEILQLSRQRIHQIAKEIEGKTGIVLLKHDAEI